ncbi:MAG: DNA alkylation repair protein [Deltaproteobacteria bacterium]
MRVPLFTDDYTALIRRLKGLANPRNAEGMRRYGIRSRHMLGIPMPELRRIARENGTDHRLALRLWDSGIHEAQILASMVDVPAEVTEAQMERWVRDFDSWGICDQVCNNLFNRTPRAYKKAGEWTERPEEYVKRAGFVLMTVLCVHDKKAQDTVFAPFLKVIGREASDQRNFVKKAVNWSLRVIGKRSLALNLKAVRKARELARSDSPAARWTGKDALRELTSDKTREGVMRRERRAGRRVPARKPSRFL